MRAMGVITGFLMMAFWFDNIAILNVGNVFYRYIFMGISKDKD